MTNHYYIYLGRENGKRVVHKVGQTRQTCYARCKNADYKIGCAFEFTFIPMYEEHKKMYLNKIEREIIHRFKELYKIEHGNEYFRTPKQNWDIVKPIFIAEMEKIISKWEIIFADCVFHEGWVAPNTY